MPDNNNPSSTYPVTPPSLQEFIKEYKPEAIRAKEILDKLSHNYTRASYAYELAQLVGKKEGPEDIWNKIKDADTEQAIEILSRDVPKNIQDEIWRRVEEKTAQLVADTKAADSKNHLRALDSMTKYTKNAIAEMIRGFQAPPEIVRESSSNQTQPGNNTTTHVDNKSEHFSNLKQPLTRLPSLTSLIAARNPKNGRKNKGMS